MTAVWGGISKPPSQSLILSLLVFETLVDMNLLMDCSAQEHFIEQQFLFLIQSVPGGMCQTSGECSLF
jgi:hypothetical protein